MMDRPGRHRLAAGMEEEVGAVDVGEGGHAFCVDRLDEDLPGHAQLFLVVEAGIHMVDMLDAGLDVGRRNPLDLAQLLGEKIAVGDTGVVGLLEGLQRLVGHGHGVAVDAVVVAVTAGRRVLEQFGIGEDLGQGRGMLPAQRAEFVVFTAVGRHHPATGGGDRLAGEAEAGDIGDAADDLAVDIGAGGLGGVFDEDDIVFAAMASSSLR